MKKKCNHFWEVVFPIINIRKQKCKCIKCGKIEKKELPVLNIEK